jgi:hypothetical protein
MQTVFSAKESKLSYSGNLLVENRNGLIVNAEVFVANGTAERDAALVMLERIPCGKQVTVGGDKGSTGRIPWRPAAIPAGVVLKPGQRFAFDNLRHSPATFLINNKENDMKTVQGLLRHANLSTTLGLYAQSVNSSMVKAQESMLKVILRNGSDAVN